MLCNTKSISFNSVFLGIFSSWMHKYVIGDIVKGMWKFKKFLRRTNFGKLKVLYFFGGKCTEYR